MFRLIRLALLGKVAYSERMSAMLSGNYEKGKPKLLGQVSEVLRRKPYRLLTGVEHKGLT